ncbi:hypothetical protein POTOM_016649 [Populus tomentosa]|uniref:AT hook motif-containing protein n=1 Tax=Populus tomentosa TaxID=118781 RepID=A0A8X8D3G1_POPTO|nr:hypothetical protein POTOM_016649 [Populus tomentosa]
MNPLSQGTGSSPVDPPMKRKRGRPRKDESAVLGEKAPVMPESDNMKKNKQTVGPTDAAGVNMVGRVITGVIDGLFDAGYLVKVKVEDSDIPLRGLVFQPGRFTPITAENDVAPQAKMYRRADIPIPVFHPPTQLPSFVTSPKHSDKQLVELKKLAPTVQDKGLQSGYLQGSTGSLFGVNVMPPQVLGSGNENQSASATAEMEHNKIAGQHDLLQEFEASLRKGPNLNVKANEQLKSVSLPSPPADILPVSETRKQPSGDDLNLNQLVHDGVKGPRSLMEKQASPKNAGPSEPAMKIISGDDTSHLNRSPIPTGHAANTTEANTLCSPIASFPSLLFGREAIPPSQKLAAEGFSLQRVTEPQSDVPSGVTNIMKAGVDISAATSLPATLFGREAILPESKAAADEPVLPRMTEPQLCNSPDVTNNVDSNIKDAIPPAES